MEGRMAWERLYAKGQFLKLEIHPEIVGIAKLFKSRGVRRVLDLGCGGGRHTVFLAKEGFKVFGLDIAPTGLCHTIRALAENTLIAHVTLSDMQVLPYESEFFGAVISVQVIHHNRLKDIKQTVSEIWRVLRPKGLVWVTVPVPKPESTKGGHEIEPGTFVPLNGIEKGLPHHHFTKETLVELFREFNFSVIDLHIDVKTHYSALAEKNRC